jgi:hypothetical protein
MSIHLSVGGIEMAQELKQVKAIIQVLFPDLYK